MPKNKEKIQKIKVSSLLMIAKEVNRVHHKVESLVRGHYTQDHTFSEADLLSILELRVSSGVIGEYLDELITQASEAEVDHLHLYPEEIMLIANLAKTLAMAEKITFSGTSMVEN